MGIERVWRIYKEYLGNNLLWKKVKSESFQDFLKLTQFRGIDNKI